VNEIVLEKHFGPEDREENEYPLLPFEVPPGVGKLHVSYTFSDAISADMAGEEKGNIVDIGLFDSRGAAFPTDQGFRGWSGTTLEEFTIGLEEASPGYIPGPIEPGTWHILLGLYQLTPDGCDVRVVIRPEAGAGEGRYLLPCLFDPSPLNTEPGWYRGELHSHSHHSDGKAPIEDLVAAARAQGLDFLAITEHNTVSHLPEICKPVAPDLLVIPGLELSTYHGHVNLWPVTELLDFRISTDEQMETVREMAQPRGFLFSVNHPKEKGPEWDFGSFFDPDCMEVWGGPWFISNYQALATWDELLRQGHKITAVGGSDKHQEKFEGELGWYEIGTPTTWVWAESLAIQEIARGLREGHVFISEGPEGPRLEFTAEVGSKHVMMGETLPLATSAPVHLTCRVWGAAGSVLRLVSAQRVLQVEIPDDDFTYTWELEVEEEDRYFRPEVIEPPEAPLDEEPAALMAKALGNPIYM
jgi:hypothetical protein